MLASQHVHRSLEKNFLIILDSLATLQSLLCSRFDHPLVVQLHTVHVGLLRRNKDIDFLWTPGHNGIPGNVRAVQATKASCQSLVSPDCKSIFMTYVQFLEQCHWDALGHNKLHATLPCLSDRLPPCCPVWEEEVD